MSKWLLHELSISQEPTGRLSGWTMVLYYMALTAKKEHQCVPDRKLQSLELTEMVYVTSASFIGQREILGPVWIQAEKTGFLWLEP